jgi:hypothetical protein
MNLGRPEDAHEREDGEATAGVGHLRRRGMFGL